MSFLTDTNWPVGLQRVFDLYRQVHHRLEPDNRYYGPYIKLLTYCFGPGFDFSVTSENPRNYILDYDTQGDIIVFLVVYDAHRHPVLMAEIKDDNCVDSNYQRYVADKQMRLRFEAKFEDCPLPRLWGLSLFGTSLRVYVADHATYKIEPTTSIIGSSNGRRFHRDYLEGAWDIDILSQEGFNKMKEIVEDITTALHIRSQQSPP